MSNFKRLRIDELPLNSDGNCYFDLYVYMPLNARYVRYVAAGEEVAEKRLSALHHHADPTIYVSAMDFSDWMNASTMGIDANFGGEPADGEGSSRVTTEAAVDASKLIRIAGDKRDLGATPKLERAPAKGIQLDAREMAELEARFGGTNGAPERFTPEEETFLREPIRDELFGLYRDLRAVDAKGDELDRIESVTSKLLNTIAPDVDSLRNLLAQNAKYLYVMTDSAAITSIAVLFAVAKGFSSRNVFKDLAYSAILMDMALADLNEAELRQYYVDPEKLSPAARKIALEHPAASYKMLKGRLRTMSDICGQLIVNHHELYNGRGFPRRVRSDILAPLARVLALAVDIFETLKRAQILGQSLSLRDAVAALTSEKVEPHLRRHSRKLVEDVLKLLDSPEMDGVLPKSAA